jgi:hypothetical protein
MAVKKNCKAPMNLEKLMGLGITTFTADDLVYKMHIPMSEVRQMICLGQHKESIRIAIELGKYGREKTLYECIHWRRYWMSRPWRPVNGELAA